MAQPTPAHPSTMAAQLAAAPQPPTPSSPLPPPTITTPRLLIRPMHPQDAPSMQRHAAPASIAKYLSLAFPHPYTLTHAENRIALTLKDRLDNYVLCLPSAPEVTIGGIGIKPGSDVQAHAGEIGYWIGEEYQGQGLVSEALYALTKWVFEEGCTNEGKKLTKLFAGVFSGNTASMKVLEKNGYRAEGVLKGHVEKHGVVMDLHYFGVTKGDWMEWSKAQAS